MFKKISENRVLQYAISFLLLIGVIGCIYLPEMNLFKWSVQFANQIMLAYLGLGLLFLIINFKKQVLVSFACCGAMCLFLKDASNSNLRLPTAVQGEKINVAHFNVSSAAENYNYFFEQLKNVDADIISFQEVTPDWAFGLKKILGEQYPFHCINARIDPYGWLISLNNPSPIRIRSILNPSLPSSSA